MNAAAERYSKAKRSRQEHVEKILTSEARKKVVVAGPGTGKTSLFKEILAGKPASLTLSFINSLVDDLRLELFELSDVRTLHSFARSAFSKATNQSIFVYPMLGQVIREDANILLGADIDFEKIFHERNDKSEHLEFYRERREYYGCYGFTDMIFAAVKYFEKKRERIPSYDQIVVDEFQDFNKLEVSLIELLAERSPIVLVGDDDQALYEFKSASLEHIRFRHNAKDSSYAAFNLPFCSRCTRVIIEAANDIIAAAQKNGFLKGRIDKPFIYFDCEEKDADSAKYPVIDYSQDYSRQVPWAISEGIKTVAVQQRAAFDVLVIAPYKKQCLEIARALRGKGFQNVACVEREEPEPTLLDGAKELLEDKHSNLGWRIIARCRLGKDEFDRAVQASKDKTPMEDCLRKEFKNEVRDLLKRIRQVKSNAITDGQLLDLFRELAMDPLGEARATLQELIDGSDRQVPGAIRRIPIRVTTFQSSKGLAADLVYIAHCDDRYLIRSKTAIADRDICSFVVALTRARKKAAIISTVDSFPTFVSWIDPKRLNVIRTIQGKK